MTLKSWVPAFPAYQQALRKLQGALALRVAENVLEESAAALGLLRGGKIVTPNNSAAAALAEHSVFDTWVEGKPYLETLLSQLEPTSVPEEIALREALPAARFSIYQVAEVDANVGVTLRDVFRRLEIPVLDPSLGVSAIQGFVFAARLLPLKDFAILTEAMLRVPSPSYVDGVFNRLEANTQIEAVAALNDPKTRTNICRYLLAAEDDLRRHAATQEREKVGRNDPCPCGSGKKFKRCHGA